MNSARKPMTILPAEDVPIKRDNYRECLDELQGKIKRPTLSGIAVKRKGEE